MTGYSCDSCGIFIGQHKPPCAIGSFTLVLPVHDRQACFQLKTKITFKGRHDREKTHFCRKCLTYELIAELKKGLGIDP